MFRLFDDNRGACAIITFNMLAAFFSLIRDFFVIFTGELYSISKELKGTISGLFPSSRELEDILDRE